MVKLYVDSGLPGGIASAMLILRRDHPPGVQKRAQVIVERLPLVIWAALLRCHLFQEELRFR
jgi:hypothetical protein